MEIRQISYAAVAVDGRNTIAVARLKGDGSWILTARNFCWIDEDARKPNTFGFIQPEFLSVRTKAQALKILKSL